MGRNQSQGESTRAKRRGPAALVSLAAYAGLAACTPLGLNTASTKLPPELAATPPVLGVFGADPAVTTAADWTSRRAPLLRQAFERDVYGPVPVNELKGVEVSRRVVDPDFAGGLGVLEEIDVRLKPASGEMLADAPSYRIALAIPKSASASRPAPLIIAENFCGNPGNLGSDLLSPPAAAGACDGSGFMGQIIRLIFGTYIIESPMEQILSRGYAYAAVFPSELVADGGGPEQAAADLARFQPMMAADRMPYSAVAVWAAAFSWSIDVLDNDPRLSSSQTSLYGHSRHGKASLLAGAFDPRIEVVISHQSGKGGASLTRAYAGESVAQITRSYPHWFAPAYAAWADNEQGAPVDQHQLIALMAPRPILLGNGWKDVWSDPTGSFRAAQGADAAYRLLGVPGLAQPGLKSPPTDGAIEFYIRSGGHGVRKVDWAYFLDYLDRVMGAPPTKQAPSSSGEATISR